MAQKTIQAKISYLTRGPKYEAEKPFVVTFPVEGISGATQTNHTFEIHEREIQDARPDLGLKYCLDETGFTFVEHSTSLSNSDFETSDAIETKYYAEITELIRTHFPRYKDLVFLDHELRKRSPDFPHQKNATVKFSQPLALPHLDYTTKGAQFRLRETLRDKHEDLMNREFEILNIWRVLRGPNNDWPLALCDYRSVDVGSDTIANDIVFRQTVGENELLLFNQHHRWVYVSSQMPNEVIVFRNASSSGASKARAWHAAFQTSSEDNVSPIPRESIEVRVAAFI